MDITGQLPEKKHSKKIVSTAMHEFLTNTLRHAKTDRMSVVVESADENARIVLENEGILPDKEFTEREMDVLRMLVSGYSDKEIADKLDMSYHTVRFHMNTLLSKTGCNSRTDLAIKVARSGIVVM